jgi:hypothetical protein
LVIRKRGPRLKHPPPFLVPFLVLLWEGLLPVTALHLLLLLIMKRSRQHRE